MLSFDWVVTVYGPTLSEIRYSEHYHRLGRVVIKDNKLKYGIGKGEVVHVNQTTFRISGPDRLALMLVVVLFILVTGMLVVVLAVLARMLMIMRLLLGGMLVFVSVLMGMLVSMPVLVLMGMFLLVMSMFVTVFVIVFMCMFVFVLVFSVHNQVSFQRTACIKYQRM